MPQLQNLEWESTADCEKLAQMAAQAALFSNWNTAIKINLKILKSNENNVEAMNRLAKAHICLGEPQKAENLYKKVLAIDPYNIIARKNMEKISKAKGSVAGVKAVAPTINLSSLFLTEPGKTKVINLLNLAAPSILSVLNFGEQLSFKTKNHSVCITTSEGTYLGALPDDLAHRLISFIAGGNKYEAFVKSVSPKNLTVFIRETYRSPKFINQPSFQPTQISYFEEEA